MADVTSHLVVVVIITHIELSHQLLEAGGLGLKSVLLFEQGVILLLDLGLGGSPGGGREFILLGRPGVAGIGDRKLAGLVVKGVEFGPFLRLDRGLGLLEYCLLSLAVLLGGLLLLLALLRQQRVCDRDEHLGRDRAALASRHSHDIAICIGCPKHEEGGPLLKLDLALEVFHSPVLLDFRGFSTGCGCDRGGWRPPLLGRGGRGSAPGVRLHLQSGEAHRLLLILADLRRFKIRGSCPPRRCCHKIRHVGWLPKT
mmetsp:Transcript_26475/g.69648  ORF Transcript_26475/g.69648 Transcript_26475/m.69648 type:complete len:256 (+) Transcript_26475:223-990(+)